MARHTHHHRPRASAGANNRGAINRRGSQRQPGLTQGVMDWINYGTRRGDFYHPTAATLRRENEELKRDISRGDAEIAGLKAQHARLSEDKRSLNDRNEQLTEDNATLQRHLKAVDEECDELLAEHHELDGRYHRLVDDCRALQSQNEQDQSSKASLQSRIEELTKAADECQNTIENLKSQVLEYKSAISASTRMEDQVADDIIDAKAGQIFFALQNFAVQNFRSVKLDITVLPENTKAWLSKNTLDAQKLLPGYRVKIIIAIIAKTLAAQFNAEFCFGVSDAPSIKAATSMAKSHAGKHPETKRWVNATRALISRDDPGALEQADNHMLYDTMRMIMQDLEKAAPISWTENVQTALGKIIAATIELFRLLQSQNADFHIGFARVTNTEGHHRRYSPSWTEDIDNEMEGGGQNFVVGLSVFPGIFKCGDERGENMETRTVVSKAKVVMLEIAPPAGPVTRSQQASSTTSSAAVYGGSQPIEVERYRGGHARFW